MIDTSDLELTLPKHVVDELLKTYRQDLETRIAQLTDATDPDEIRRHAHGLRSGAATFHATHLADAARAVEHDPNIPLDDVNRAAAQLLAAMDARREPSRPHP